MIALARLAAEDPVDEDHVVENDRQHHQRSYQHEDVGRASRLCRLQSNDPRTSNIDEDVWSA